MAYNTFLHNTVNSDYPGEFQHAITDFYADQNNQQHLVPYSIQGQGDMCSSPAYSLQPRLQLDLGVPQNCHPNFSNTQMTAAMNYQTQPLYQQPSIKTLQHPVQSFPHPTQLPQNLHLLRSQVNRQTAPVGRLVNHSPHFKLPAYTNSSVLPTHENFQHTLQSPQVYSQQNQQQQTLQSAQGYSQQNQQQQTLQSPQVYSQQKQQQQTLQSPQGYSQQNQQISLLHNQQNVAAFPAICTTSLQSNKKSLESANLFKQHKVAYHNSNADLIQCSQENHPPFGNQHTVQAIMNSFGHEFRFSSHMSHGGNQIRTFINANSTNQSNASNCPTSIPQVILSESSNMQQSKCSQSDVLPNGSQKLRNTTMPATHNQMYNMPVLNNPVSSYGCNLLTEHREIAPAHLQYLDNSKIVPSKSTAVSSDGDILPIQKVHSRPMNPAPSQNKIGENLICHGNINVKNARSKKDINPTNLERSINDHTTNVDCSINKHHFNEERSVSSHPTGVSWIESNVKESGRSFQWYKYPEKSNDLPFTSDMQAMQADSTDYASTAEACCRSQRVKSSVEIEQTAQTFPESQTGVNETASGFGINYSKVANIDSSPVTKDNCVSNSSLPSNANTNNSLVTKSSTVTGVNTVDLTSVKTKSTSVKMKSILTHLLAIDAAAYNQRKQHISSVNSNLQLDMPVRLQSTENINKIVTNKNEYSNKSAVIAAVSKDKGDKTQGSVSKTASKKKGKDSVNSDKDIADSSKVSKPPTLFKKVSLNNTSKNMKPADKDTISLLSQVDILARNQATGVNRSSNNKYSRNFSDVLTIPDSVNDSTIDRTLQDSGNLFNTTLETQTGNSLIDTALETQADNETHVTITKKVTDFKIMKDSILQDPKLKDSNNITGLAGSVENRRHTSPSLSDRQLLDSEHENEIKRSLLSRKHAPRLSLEIKNLQRQSILLRQKHVHSVEDQNISNHRQNVSVPSTIAPKTMEKFQSESYEKKTMTAREKVFNNWKSGQVVCEAGKERGAKAVSRTTKRTNNCTNPEVELPKSIALKETSADKEIPVRLALAISHDSTRGENVHNTPPLLKMDKLNKELTCAMIYIMLHGHKLICLKSDTESLILLCQFLYECFPDTGLGSVNNCINRSLQINKMTLEHPEKERIIMFLKKNGYQVENLVQTISVNDAIKIYHHMFKITNCSNGTCVIELPDGIVDLDVFDSSNRKTLTREIMSRLTKVGHFEEQDRDPENSLNISTDAEYRQNEVDGNLKKKISDEPLSSQLPMTVTLPAVHPDSPGSDHTVAYGKSGEDDPDDVTLVIIVDDPYLICWSPGTIKRGGLSNTCLGQLRSYIHNNETFLAVDDLCRVFGDTKFNHGVTEGNISLYSCCSEIANFLNSLSEKFPPLKSLNNSLVKASDIGVNKTVTAQCHSDQDGSSRLKKSLCKDEDFNGDCSPNKQARLDNTVLVSEVCNINIVKNEFSMANDQTEVSKISVIQKDVHSSYFPFIGLKEEFQSNTDRMVAGMEITNIMIQDAQTEASAGKSSLPSAVVMYPPKMSVHCQGADNYLCSIDLQPVQESSSRSITNTGSSYLDINNGIMAFSKDDNAPVRSDACSSPCSLKSSSSLGEPSTLILGDTNNPTPPLVSSNEKPDHNSWKSNLEVIGNSISDNLSEATNNHTSTQQPVTYISHCKKPEQQSDSDGRKHLEIPCNQGQNSFSTPCVNTMPESAISFIDSKSKSLKNAHKSHNLVETSKYSLGSKLCTSSLTNNESAGDEASLSRPRAVSLNDKNGLPLIRDVPDNNSDIAVESTCDLNRNNSAHAMSNGFCIKIVPEPVENITANASEQVISSSECEVAQQTARHLPLIMLALSDDLETSLPSTVQPLGKQRAIDDIDVMTGSSAKMLVPPSYRKAFTKLMQEQRTLLGLVDLLNKRLALSEEARVKSDKMSKYYEGLIHDITSTFKNGDLESIDC